MRKSCVRCDGDNSRIFSHVLGDVLWLLQGFGALIKQHALFHRLVCWLEPSSHAFSPCTYVLYGTFWNRIRCLPLNNTMKSACKLSHKRFEKLLFIQRFSHVFVNPFYFAPNLVCFCFVLLFLAYFKNFISVFQFTRSHLKEVDDPPTLSGGMNSQHLILPPTRHYCKLT